MTIGEERAFAVQTILVFAVDGVVVGEVEEAEIEGLVCFVPRFDTSGRRRREMCWTRREVQRRKRERLQHVAQFFHVIRSVTVNLDVEIEALINRQACNRLRFRRFSNQHYTVKERVACRGANPLLNL